MKICETILNISERLGFSNILRVLESVKGRRFRATDIEPGLLTILDS